MVYFTSDLHFGHENILNWRNGFSSIKEMDETLISNWNGRVHKNDYVIITGDLIYKNKCPTQEYLSALKGRKILVKGNHDNSWLKDLTDEEISRYFEGVYDLYSFKRNGVKLRFCHYPMIAWESSRNESILVCGHIHNKREGLEYEMFSKVPYAFNASVDVNGMMPVTLSELINNNDAFYGTVLNNNEQQELMKKCKMFEEMS